MQITVLGVTGGIGNAVTQAFVDRGIPVVALARDPSRVPARAGLTVVQGDARNPADLARALEGSELVLHGLNLPYPQWDPAMMDLTRNVLAAAEASGATVLFPGNLYGLGPDFAAPLTEDARREPPSKKGALRNRLEAMLEASPAKTVVLRAGDFYGGVGESTWMWHLTGKARTGAAIQYPTTRSNLHSWAFVPDLARTFVALAERRDALPAHATFHFEGHVVDGDTWIRAVQKALGDPNRKVTSFPWMWMQLARPFVPMVRELFEMRYLWDQPVRMDGARLRAFLGEVPTTPFEEAVAQALA
ncbi:MAG: NAD(P)H-binding protein [Myxococcota bacterium]